MDATHKVIARIAGAIFLLFGIGLVTFATWAAVSLVLGDTAFTTWARFFVAVCFVLGFGMCLSGFRLATNRPNEYRSSLPPVAWQALTVALATLGAALGILSILKGESQFVTGALFASLVAWWCYVVAKRTRGDAGGMSVPADNPLGESNASRSGYFRLISLRGIPVFVHVSVPLGGVWLAAYAGFEFENSFYYCIGYVLLIGAHEAGHALAAALLGIKVHSIDISGAGGRCLFDMPRKLAHGAVVTAGGIGVQLILLLATRVYVQAAGGPVSPFGQSMVTTFTTVNIILIGWNLMPIQSRGLATDGMVLWRMLRHALGKRVNEFELYDAAVPSSESPVFLPDTQLLTKPSLVPAGFKQGIEILNDRTTPMDVVAGCLAHHLELEPAAAMQAMLDIHNNGGILIALPSMERAMEVATGIRNQAQQHGHMLVCRAVEVPAEIVCSVQLGFC